MPRFFFHLYDDLITEDEEGIELPDLEAAVALGVRSVRDVVAEQVRHGHLGPSTRIELTNECGRVLRTISFDDVVEVRRWEHPARRMVAHGR